MQLARARTMSASLFARLPAFLVIPVGVDVALGHATCVSWPYLGSSLSGRNHCLEIVTSLSVKSAWHAQIQSSFLLDMAGRYAVFVY